MYQPKLGVNAKDPKLEMRDHWPALRDRYQDVYFNAQDGTRLNGWYVPPKAGKPVIIFAHGNAGDIGTWIGPMYRFTNAGYGFFLFDYRGYGLSKGIAQEKGLYQDMDAASHYLTQTYGILSSQQIAMGVSLGSGAVVDSATRIPYKMVVLMSTFTSMPDVAQSVFFPLPMQYFVHQRYDSLSKIDRIRCPLIIAQGDHDTMMPMALTKKLYARATTRHKKLIVVKNAGHNDVIFMGADDVMKAIEANKNIR